MFIRRFRYYHQEKDDNFVYIAMEMGVGTLQDYVDGSLKTTIENIEDISILKEATNGLVWLHSRDISKYVAYCKLISSVLQFLTYQHETFHTFSFINPHRLWLFRVAPRHRGGGTTPARLAPN